MTTYTFLGLAPAIRTGRGSSLGPIFPDWGDPAQWSTGVVPNAPDADVVFPAVFAGSTTYVTVRQSYAVRSLSVTSDEIDIGYLLPTGSLAVSGALSLTANAELRVTFKQTDSAGTLSIDPTSTLSGTGTFNVAGLFTNAGTISMGGASITAGSFTNSGTLFGAGITVTVTGGPGAFTNLSGGVLTGGTYNPFAYPINLNVGGTITTDAATIILQGATLTSYDDAAGAYEPLEATLRTIAPGGSLVLDALETFTTANVLSVAGTLTLTGMGLITNPTQGPTLTAAELDVAGGGNVSGFGTINGPIVDNGTVTSGVAFYSYPGGKDARPATLTLASPVTGSGTLVVGAGDPAGHFGPVSSTLELAGATANPVLFADGTGILRLDNPASFKGVVTPAATEATTVGTYTNNQVILTGILLASVTGYSYAGTATGGTLTIQENGGQQTLAFAGHFTTGSFAFGVAPGSSDLDIRVTPFPAAPTLVLPSGSTAKAIVNSTTPVLAGVTQPGTTVSFSASGVAAGVATATAPAGGVLGGYAAFTSPLGLGYQDVSAFAANAAGAAAATNSLDLFLLPTAVAGVTTADYTSLDISKVLGQGYGFQFIGGTQEVRLLNGTVSTGTDTNAAFVQRLYEGLLGRAGDTPGLVNASASLAAGVSPVTIAASFLSSPEYMATRGTQSDSQFVTALYQGMLGRTPGGGELAGWANQLASGATRGFVAASFAISGEARSHLAGTTADIWVPDANGELVTQLYATGLGRDPVGFDVSAWSQQLLAGLSPQQLAQDIASSPEFGADHNGQSLADFVTSLYQCGLGRTPGAPEQAGWVGQLQGGATPANVLLGISTSAEAYAHLSPAV